MRRLVDATPDGLVCARAEETPLLRYYANSIAHLLGAPRPEADQAVARAA
jgi:hypothetical protein